MSGKLFIIFQAYFDIQPVVLNHFYMENRGGIEDVQLEDVQLGTCTCQAE